MKLCIGQAAYAAAHTSSKLPTLVAQLYTGSYTFSWTTPDNIKLDDATNASITGSTFDVGTTSRILQASTFGHAIPPGATILGIEILVEKYHANGDVVDGTVQLTKTTEAAVGDEKADTSTHWEDSATIKTYGSPTDLWGTTWEPEEINSPNFGVWFAATAHSNDADAYIDYIRVIVYYRATAYLDGHAETSLLDIRFTTSDGTTTLDYFRQGITGATPNQFATLWLEFDSIGTAATTFYLYYGNAAAPDVSSGPNTFPTYDGIERGANGDALTSPWTVVQGAVKISTAQAFEGSRSAWFDAGATTPKAYVALTASNTIAIQARFYFPLTSGNRLTLFWHEDAAGAVVLLAIDADGGSDGTLFYSTDEGWVSCGVNLADGFWHLVEVRNFDWTALTFDVVANGTVVASGCPMATESLFYPNKLAVEAYTGAGQDLYIDELIVRPFLATEPTWGSWGSEEAAPSGWAHTFLGVTSPAVALGEPDSTLDKVLGV
jgi:hypothetical protein